MAVVGSVVGADVSLAALGPRVAVVSLLASLGLRVVVGADVALADRVCAVREARVRGDGSEGFMCEWRRRGVRCEV